MCSYIEKKYWKAEYLLKKNEFSALTFQRFDHRGTRLWIMWLLSSGADSFWNSKTLKTFVRTPRSWRRDHLPEACWLVWWVWAMEEFPNYVIKVSPEACSTLASWRPRAQDGGGGVTRRDELGYFQVPSPDAFVTCDGCVLPASASPPCAHCG